MKGKKLILVVLCLFLSGCAGQKEEPVESKESSIFEASEVITVQVIPDIIDIRSGRGESFQVVGQLNSGDTVEVVGKLQDWYVIHLPNDLVGCVPVKDVKPIIENMVSNQIQPARRLTSEEENMVRLINQERSRKNLSPLGLDLALTKVARIKSQDMVKNNYFSHYSPTYGSPFDMLGSFGISYLYGGENLAGNTSIDKAHTALMNSKGHRENILNPNFTHIGVGISEDSQYGNIITEIFISKPE